MSGGDDWQVGDLAVAVAKGAPHFVAGTAELGHKTPRTGGVYTVEALVTDAFCNLGLVLEGHHSSHHTRAWMASQFRRIRPLTDEEQMLASAEFKADKIITAPVEA